MVRGERGRETGVVCLGGGGGAEREKDHLKLIRPTKRGRETGGLAGGWEGGG